MAEAPRSYADPFYADLDARTAARLQLPPGMLEALRTKGERSNADQVSEAGARSVYQITPTTRALVLKRDGIDAYLSPENAAEVAGIVVKDGLNWAKQRSADPATQQRLAIGYYHGGGDTANWGPRTVAYMKRTTDGPPAGGAGPTVAPPPRQSTFSRVMATTEPDTSGSIGNLVQAYQGGRMSPEDARAFEGEVQAGRIQLPRGVSLTPSAVQGDGSPASGAADPGVGALVRAFNAGQMTPDDAADFRSLLGSGQIKIPAGGEQPRIPGTNAGIPGATLSSDTAGQPKPGMLDQAWAGVQAGANTLAAGVAGGAGALYGALEGVGENIGSLLAGQQPQLSVEQNMARRAQQFTPELPQAMQTPLGREYTENVGNWIAANAPAAGPLAPELSVIGRAMAPLTRAAGDAARAAPEVVRGGVQTLADQVRGIVSTGAGERPTAVPTGARMSPPGPAAALPPGATTPGAPVPAATAAAGAPVAAEAGGPAAAMSGDELAATTRRAALGGFGSAKATKTLAQQVAPDAETVAAAQRLGVLDHLQPDHYTTNQAYRQLAQLVKSQTGSDAHAAQHAGLMRVTEAASSIIDELGGTADLSTLSVDAASKLKAANIALKSKAGALYDQVDSAIPRSAPVEAPSILRVLRQNADDLGGEANLPAVQRDLLAKLDPDTAGAPPTYALLDTLRKDIGEARRGKQNAFGTANTYELGQLETALREDQRGVAAAAGVGDKWDLAQATSKVYKGLQDDLKAIYGVNLDKSMAPLLTKSIKGLSAGDTSNFVRLLKATPEDMRQEVTASGLASFFKRAAADEEMSFTAYAKWFEGVQQNRAAYNALMANLPAGAPEKLADLARVSRGVALSKGQFLSTGKAINPKALAQADTMIERVFEEVRRRGAAGLVAEGVGTASGVPGLASALQSALSSNKTTIMQAADKLITSPQFVEAVNATGVRASSAAAATATAALGRSRVAGRFLAAARQPTDAATRQRWAGRLAAATIGAGAGAAAVVDARGDRRDGAEGGQRTVAGVVPSAGR